MWSYTIANFYLDKAKVFSPKKGGSAWHLRDFSTYEVLDLSEVIHEAIPIVWKLQKVLLELNYLDQSDSIRQLSSLFQMHG